MRLQRLGLAFAVGLLWAGAVQAEGPTYRVDPAWRPQMPANWALGAVSSVAVDKDDHVWILQRPSSLTADEKGATAAPPLSKCCIPAPPVIETDRDGRVLRSWGGPGQGYDWPSNEHGILVDHKGNVWISGADLTDGMILKFTADGKFLKQLGHAAPFTNSLDKTMFGRPTSFAEDAAANEIYVSDGYVNHRVVVLDEDTLEVKRLWGAYGKPPTDLTLPRYNPQSPQFDTVHCVSRAPDGLLYVCDRQNNRVQVFKGDGTFVQQFVFEPKTLGPGSTWGVAVSPRDPDYVIMADGSNNQMTVWRRKDGVVTQTYGRSGRYAGEFHWVHHLAVDSRGDVYTAEVDNAKRLQKWTRGD